jgi:hypothetical protein
MTVVSRQGRSFNAFTLVLVLVVGFVTLLGAANLNSGPKTAVVLAGLVVVAVGVRAFHISLSFDDDEVVIGNLVRTRRYRWSELEAVSSRPIYTPFVDGRVLRLVRFVPRGGGWGTAAQATSLLGKRRRAVLDALRAEAERHGVRYELTLDQENALN